MNSLIIGAEAPSSSLTSVKRGRGRPKNTQESIGLSVVKRGRGRPRKNPTATIETTIKKGRGRPRKYMIIERDRDFNGAYKPAMKKVESGHLLKHMMNYYTKLMIIHGQLAAEGGIKEPLFQKLKGLDFQMAEMCKKVLANEYSFSEEEEAA